MMNSYPKKMCTVIVPIYKTNLSSYEELSLRRCFDVFRNQSITIVAPQRLDLFKIDFLSGLRFDLIRFDDKYFIGTASYNRLMLSPEFYDNFSGFEFILINQLDAFAFSDELEFWCNAGYDYIGAPWFGAYIIKDFNISCLFAFWARWIGKFLSSKEHAVGNGGFSLRKVSTFRRISRYFSCFANKWDGQEDAFWSCVAPSLYPFFRIADEETAMRFSFELEPKNCYEKNCNNLPFGCHAWERYNIDFWRPIFASMGYIIGSGEEQ